MCIFSIIGGGILEFNTIIFEARNNTLEKLKNIVRYASNSDIRVVEICGEKFSGKSFILDKLFNWIEGFKIKFDLSLYPHNCSLDFERVLKQKCGLVDSNQSVENILVRQYERASSPIVIVIENARITKTSFELINTLCKITSLIPVIIFIELNRITESELWENLKQSLIKSSIYTNEQIGPLEADDIVSFLKHLSNAPYESHFVTVHTIMEYTAGNAGMVCKLISEIQKKSFAIQA